MPPFTLPRMLWNIAYSVGLGFFTNRLSTSAAAMAVSYTHLTLPTNREV